MSIYDEAAEAYGEFNALMREIDSDYWVKTGHHIEYELARDLALALLIKKNLNEYKVLEETRRLYRSG